MSVSPAQQEKENRAWCAANGIDIAWSITDPGYSASRYAKRARPGYETVGQNIAGADPVDILVAWECSRVQRDLEVHVELRKLCTEYGRNTLLAYKGRIYDFTRPDDRFQTALDAILAERESDETRERIMRSIRANVAAGKPHGRLPYGYRSLHDTATGDTVGRIPDDLTGPVVAEIIQRVGNGDTGYAIAADLTARAVPSPHEFRSARLGRPVDDPRPWTLEQVHRIARNPAYAALRVHKGKVVGEGTWEPIVSLEEHGRAVDRLAQPGRKSWTDASTKHLLTGIARCGVCGARCRLTKNRGYPSYSCWGGKGTGCVARRQEYVDDRVTEAILEVMEKPGIVAQLAAAQDNDDGGAAEAAQELEDLKLRLAGFVDAAADGAISPAALAQIEGKLQPQIDDARRRAAPSAVPPEVRKLAGPGARDRWEHELTMSERRAVVRSLVEVLIHRSPRKHGSRGFDPTLIEIRWL